MSENKNNLRDGLLSLFYSVLSEVFFFLLQPQEIEMIFGG